MDEVNASGAWKRQDERRRKIEDKYGLEQSKTGYLRQPEMYNEILKHQNGHDEGNMGNLKIRAIVYDDGAPVMEVYCTYFDVDKGWCGWWEHFVNGEIV